MGGRPRRDASCHGGACSLTAVLVDTSAWIELLRDTGSPACEAVGELLTSRPDEVAITEPVAMELLAGATGMPRRAAVEQLVNGLAVLSVDPRLDFHTAAAAYRAARESGHTVRSLTDCLIAAVAVRHDVPLVHRDVDYDVLAQVLTGLTVRSYG